MSNMTINNINDIGTTDDNMINGHGNGIGNGNMGNSDVPVSDIRHPITDAETDSTNGDKIPLINMVLCSLMHGIKIV